MIEPLHFVVLTPAETLLDVELVQHIQLWLADGGGLSIYPGHAPLLAKTLGGEARYTDNNGTHEIELEPGILRITREKVMILVPGKLQAEQEAAVAPGEEREARFERLAATLLEALRSEPELADE